MAADGARARRRARAAAFALALPIGLLDAAVGVCSSLVPSAFDQLALARLPRATFAVLLSLLPASATAIGPPRARPGAPPAEPGGVGLVLAGVSLSRDAG